MAAVQKWLLLIGLLAFMALFIYFVAEPVTVGVPSSPYLFFPPLFPPSPLPLN